MSNSNYGEFVRGFWLGKLLDGLGCYFVIIFDMHSGDIFPNFVRIHLVVLSQIRITGEFGCGFRLGKMLDGLGCNFVIILDIIAGRYC